MYDVPYIKKQPSPPSKMSDSEGPLWVIRIIYESIIALVSLVHIPLYQYQSLISESEVEPIPNYRVTCMKMTEDKKVAEKVIPCIWLATGSAPTGDRLELPPISAHLVFDFVLPSRGEHHKIVSTPHSLESYSLNQRPTYLLILFVNLSLKFFSFH